MGGRARPSSPSGSRPQDPRHAFGREAELLAARHLEGLGYRILERNVRYRAGELDLVALDGDTIVFVEVRARRATGHGTPFETVGRQKQRRLARAAAAWLARHGRTSAFTRFDVVSVVLPEGGEPMLDLIENAFETEAL